MPTFPIEDYRRLQKRGTEFPINDNEATPENPTIVSIDNYGNYKLIVKDVGDTNDDLISSHIDGSVKLNYLDGDQELFSISLELNIPNLNFRCCKSNAIKSGPDYYTDKRSLHFSILSSDEETTNPDTSSLDVIFETKYDCNENPIEERIKTGHFSYQLYIKDAVIEAIDYSKLATKEDKLKHSLVYR